MAPYGIKLSNIFTKSHLEIFVEINNIVDIGGETKPQIFNIVKKYLEQLSIIDNKGDLVFPAYLYLNKEAVYIIPGRISEKPNIAFEFEAQDYSAFKSHIAKGRTNLLTADNYKSKIDSIEVKDFIEKMITDDFSKLSPIVENLVYETIEPITVPKINNVNTKYQIDVAKFKNDNGECASDWITESLFILGLSEPSIPEKCKLQNFCPLSKIHYFVII